MSSDAPVGRPRKGEVRLLERHLRFLAACMANRYTGSEAAQMLQQEYGIVVSDQNVRYYYHALVELAPAVEAELKREKDLSIEAIDRALAKVAPRRRTRLVPLFDEYLKERKKIAADPTYHIPYADRRRRALKVEQNIRELDTEKTFAKGSYPVKRTAKGEMEFKEYELKAKDHTEQRKHLELMGEIVDGATGGDVIINIHQNKPPEEELDPKKEVKPSKKAEHEEEGEDTGE